MVCILSLEAVGIGSRANVSVVESRWHSGKRGVPSPSHWSDVFDLEAEGSGQRSEVPSS